VTEHLKSSIVGETIQSWCNVCHRQTEDRVYAVSTTNSAGKPGPCLEHGPKVNAQGETKRQELARKKREQDTANPPLFGDAK